MEADRNPMPEMVLFPRVQRAAEFIKRLVSFNPTSAPDYMSDHYRGGAAMLDRELYDNSDQLQLDFEAQGDKGW